MSDLQPCATVTARRLAARARHAASAKDDRAECGDSYIRKLLVTQTGLVKIPQSLIDLKRETIEIYRLRCELRKARHGN